MVDLAPIKADIASIRGDLASLNSWRSQAATEQTTLSQGMAALQQRIAALESRGPGTATVDTQSVLDAMAADGRFRGPSGRDGKDGASAAPVVIDYAKINTEVLKSLPPLRVKVRYNDAAGGVAAERTGEYKLGQDTLVLDFTEAVK